MTPWMTRRQVLLKWMNAYELLGMKCTWMKGKKLIRKRGGGGATVHETSP